MSYSFACIAVKAEKNKVIEATKDFYKSLDIKLEQVPSGEIDNGNFLLNQIDDWTIFYFNGAGINPDLEMFLSNNLSTKVIGVDQQENIGYTHFSEIDSGIPNTIFTECEGEIFDNLNIDYDHFLKAASKADPNVFSFRLDGDFELEDVERYTLEIYTLLIAEVNTQDLALKIYEMPDSIIFSHEYDNKLKGMFLRDNKSWQKLLNS